MGSAINLKKYLPLFKLRICFLITFSAVVAFLATEKGSISLDKIAILSIVMMMASTSSAVLNHYLDRDIDWMMERTRNRPLVSGRIKTPNVILFIGIMLFILSIYLSAKTLPALVAIHLLLGAFTYVVLYTIWLKRRSWLNIIIGGLSGSFAVMAGGASARPELCLPPILLATIMFFWTPSHFWSFAIFHKEEYKKAGIPMLPVVIGERRTAVSILINTILLVIASLLPYLTGASGIFYLVVAVALGILFITRNIQLVIDPSRKMAWKNFKTSMLYLGVLFTAIIVDIGIL